MVIAALANIVKRRAHDDSFSLKAIENLRCAATANTGLAAAARTEPMIGAPELYGKSRLAEQGDWVQYAFSLAAGQAAALQAGSDYFQFLC